MPWSAPRRSRTSASMSMASAPLRTASSSRAAAFPVGAARATRGGRRADAAACASRSARTLATVVVFPVPGPPATTETLRSTAVAAAMRWKSGASSPWNNRASPDASRSASTPSARRLERSSRSEATWRSSAQQTVQVQDRALEMEGAAVTHQWAPGHAGGPLLRIGPWQRADVGRRVRVGAGSATDRPEVDAHVAQPGARAAKAAPSWTATSVVPLSPASRTATWTSEVARIPARLNSRQRTFDAEGQPGVECVQRLRLRHVGAPLSKSSLSDSIRCAGGCQDQTPHG